MVFSADDKVLIKSLYHSVADWYKLLIKTLLSTLKTMFTQCCRDAITVTWTTRHYSSFTSEHYKVSKSEVFVKVIPAADFCIPADDVPKIVLKKYWWMYVKPIAGQTWDIF